jgi:hypothetical protein
MKGLQLDSMAARICSVKTLAINMGSARSLNNIIDMLRCFACLEKLYIKVATFLLIIHCVCLHLCFTNCSQV